MYWGDSMSSGFLKIQLSTGEGVIPVGYVEVLVRDCDCKQNNNRLLFTLRTDENGNTEPLELPAPPRDYSLEPGHPEHPFSCYNIFVKEPQGCRCVVINGVQIFDGQTAILPVQLTPFLPEYQGTPDEIYIPHQHGIDATDHGNNPYPDVWPGDSPSPPIDTSQPEIRAFPLANDVQIPNFITVHLGRPNAAARNVRVPFIDYIKNMIYPYSRNPVRTSITRSSCTITSPFQICF